MMYQIPGSVLPETDIIVLASDIPKYADTHVLVWGQSFRYTATRALFVTVKPHKSGHTNVIVVFDDWRLPKTEKFSFSPSTKVRLSPKTNDDLTMEDNLYQKYLQWKNKVR